MKRRVSHRLMQHPHVHSESGTYRMVCRSGVRFSARATAAKKPAATSAKSTAGRWRDFRVWIARPHVMDHSKIASAHQKPGLRTFRSIPAACRRLHLEDDWARVSHCRARSGLADKTSGRIYDQELASHKLERGATLLQLRSLPNVFSGAERARIDREERHLGRPDYGNDVQARTRRPKHRDSRPLANRGPRYQTIADRGIDETRRRMASPGVSPNRSAARRTKPSHKAQTSRTLAWRAEGRERDNVCIARTLELGRGPAGGRLMLGCVAI